MRTHPTPVLLPLHDIPSRIVLPLFSFSLSFFISTILLIDILGSRTLEVRDSDLVANYADTFIKVERWGAFHESDIGENKIYKYHTEKVPDFVAELEQELDRKPGVSPDTTDILNLIDAPFRNEYFEASQGQEEFSSESESHQGRRDAKNLGLSNLSRNVKAWG
ncbi:hypothetical protein BC827DRAFT_1251576 [Russula dissimulans]|nr:hypothetical protein BC827DRAFT_1251576 [Russula dissimulans]